MTKGDQLPSYGPPLPSRPQSGQYPQQPQQQQPQQQPSPQAVQPIYYTPTFTQTPPQQAQALQAQQQAQFQQQLPPHVIAYQPASIQWGTKPQYVTCVNCQQNVLTRVVLETRSVTSSIGAKLRGTVAARLGSAVDVDELKKPRHVCPACGALLGKGKLTNSITEIFK
ncbi:hypothetical protein BC831DRAFT_487868 [Entophlyctis helioformis]|nr:hypothetical protein BC831DRAFT_487868 [Entophlyctis helioformis]